MTRVLLVDDHDVVRQGIRRMLQREASIDICGEAATGHEAVRLAIELQPEVMVIDLSMPGLNGIDAIRRIRRDAPNTEVVVFTMHKTERLVREVLSAGAKGYVMKSDPARDLVIAVARVARHEPFVTTTPSEVILSGFAHVEHGTVRADEYSGPLTLREQEVVQLLAEGKSNKEVANILSISVKTVETHRAASMRKLGLTSVVELVHYAVRNDMIAL